MTVKEIKILCQMDFPSQTVRLWDGSGPYMDANGEIWAGMVIGDGLDRIESALNGEAAQLDLTLSGVDPVISDLAFEDLENDEVIGSRIRLLLQDIDEWGQPTGDPQVRFTGKIANMPFEEAVSGDNPMATITIECVNRFDLRTLTSGAVLSDVDQRARSAILNPGAPADRFAERIPGLAEKTIVWPRFS